MVPKFRAWLFPGAVEREYVLILKNHVKEIQKSTLTALNQRDLLRLDDWSQDITEVFLQLAADVLGLNSPVFLRLTEVYAAVSVFNDRQWRIVVKAGTGIEIPYGASTPINMVKYPSTSSPYVMRARFGIGVDVYRMEPWLAAKQANWVSENIRLIKSVSSEYLSGVEGVVRRGVMAGNSVQQLRDEIFRVGDVSLNRSELIARDQIGKANGELIRSRQQDLGLKQYTWITSHDERVRPAHKERDGKEYSWDDPPSGGNPGEPIQCRCWASPLWQE